MIKTSIFHLSLDEETIKNAYLKVLNILLKDKELLISNLLLVKKTTRYKFIKAYGTGQE